MQQSRGKVQHSQEKVQRKYEKVCQSELSAGGTKQDVENTPKFTCLNITPARRFSLVWCNENEIYQMKLNCLHLIIIQHDLPLCRGRDFQMSFLRETQLSPIVKVRGKVALSYMLIIFEISLESLSLCLGVFSFLAAFLFRTEHFYHFEKLLARSADGND